MHRLLAGSGCSWPFCCGVLVGVGSLGGNHMRLLCLTVLLLAGAPILAQPYTGPIIDVHLHVGKAAPGAPNPATGQPTTANTDADRERLTLERMRRHGIVLGL